MFGSFFKIETAIMATPLTKAIEKKGNLMEKLNLKYIHQCDFCSYLCATSFSYRGIVFARPILMLCNRPP